MTQLEAMRVFIFGGTQFMGRITADALLKAGHQVVLFNRQRTRNPFEGNVNVKCVKCDRMGDREMFRQSVREQGTCDVAIDFIGFQEAYVQDAIEGLTLPGSDGKKKFATKHYIFISADSIYWAQKVPHATARISEDDAHDFTPLEFEKHLDRCQQTSLGEYQLRYGGNKLACERVLEDSWQSDGFPYTILRLPDVYGPYDNLGGFWELVTAVEMRRPIPAKLHPARMRSFDDEISPDPRTRTFNWVFSEDVRDAIVACCEKGASVHGKTLNVGHEEAVHLRETASMIAEALGISPELLRFDTDREAAYPSTDYGALDVSRALRLLRPWRPRAMREAVKTSVTWFLENKDNRRYHRLVHREPRLYDDTCARSFTCHQKEVPSCWVGAPEKAAYVHNGPAVLHDSLSRFTGQAVLKFMERLMSQIGEVQITCDVQKGAETERQNWPLRHFAGHLLPQSNHSNAYRMESADLLKKTDLCPDMPSPLGDIREDEPSRKLRLGGAGARSTLQYQRKGSTCGFWDTVLLGRRKWRIFPPTTSPEVLGAAAGSSESLADSFICGPDAMMVQMQYTKFSPEVCFECEQTMGDAVVIPHGWWFQTYDDDRTLSISASYGNVVNISHDSPGIIPPMAFTAEEDDPEVIEFTLVD